MKQALIVVIFAIALVAWFFLWFRNEGAVATSAARPWPDGMGSLDAVVNRWPSLKANDASVKLTTLAEALPKNEVVNDFVEREIARGELTIGRSAGASRRLRDPRAVAARADCLGAPSSV